MKYVSKFKSIEAIDKETKEKTLVKIEESTIVHEGHSYTSSGSFLSEKYIIGYLSSDGTKITSWDGSVVFSTEIRTLCKHYNPFGYSYLGESYYLRFKHNGKVFAGITLGKGSIVKARLTKLKSLWSA